MALVLGNNGYSGTPGRKMVVVSNNGEASPPLTPLKRMFSGKITLNSESSSLETLPQEVLIKVLCGVDDEDLKQLFHVSKTIREATLIARQLFEYSTPKEKTYFAFPILFEAPNAPLGKYNKSRLNGITLADIAVTLFASMDEE